MSTYTCITCHVAFPHAELQREHYKTDWHRYNLKRKVVGMPPVTAATFQDKVKEHRIASETDKETEGISGFCCKLCQKRFSSHKAFENHRKSKKHRSRESDHLHSVEETISRDGESREKGDMIIMEEAKVEKILSDVKADMAQPRIIKSKDAKTPRDFAPGDNPRIQWFKKQAKALEGSEDSDEWEDMDEDDIEEEWDDDAEIDEDADIESLSSEALSAMKQRDISVNECLFCLRKSKSMASSIIHMSKQHGFFIPDVNFVTDLEGLLKYLGEKVGRGNICLWCNEKGKAFYSISAVIKHMRDKGHCNMFVTGDAALEYADFYDFGTMDADDDEDYSESDEDITDPAPTESQELELVLPSGASIGHRALMKYYKQKFPTIDRSTTKKQRTLAKVMSQYKALGWHSGTNNSKMQKDLAYLKTMKSKYHLKLSVKNNKTMMKHFRSQIFM